jgi:two-component system chemotaxis sensor kinase CheA
MRARLVPAAEMLERVPLLVRGLARSTGKEVTLDLDPGKAELDKAVAERIFPAIIHLVRNAVDHGLESPAERIRAGKPPGALLRMTCLPRSSNQLELTIADDGRGIDVAALARRAGRPVPTGEEALLALMTLPGVSTVEAATTTSGRGMGMNIVKQAVVDELGGELTVRTERGKGTTFILRVPLSITIVDAFAFRCGHQPFVVPVSVVEEIVEVDPAAITRAPSGKGRAELRMLDRRGTAVPLVRLDGIFHLEPEQVPVRKAIVVRRNGQPYAFEVDQMVGQQEVVVRPLDDPLVRRPGIVGSTDLGDGQPTLVLDLLSLSATLSRRRTDVRA